MGRKTAHRVFISSTWIDNEERRRLVEDAVLRADMVPVGMERFTASDQPTVNECCDQVRGCDLLVVIVARRYGSRPPRGKLSYTEIEYDTAVKAKLPRLVFEIDRATVPAIDDDFDPGPERWSKQGQLEKFRTKLARAQMRTTFTDLTLGTRVLHALNNWRDSLKKRRRTRPTAAPRDDAAFAAYRALADELHSTIKLAGFKVALRVPMALDDLFVPLRAMVTRPRRGTAAYGSAAEAESQFGDGEITSDVALIEAFREARKQKRRGLVILGDPGSGKTTQMRRLVVSCLRDGPDTLGLADGLLPVFLPLRRLGARVSGLEAFVDQVVAEDYPSAARGLGARLLERGRLLLLFDGLDEVDAARRALASRWIEEVASERSTCVPVVTCRFAGYTGDARLGKDFLELHIRPLTREQADAFIRSWYKAVEGAARNDPAWQGETRLAAKAEELVVRLQDDDFRVTRLVEMTRNPLLLTNLCLVHFDRGQLPRGRARLYEECIDVLLERWRGEGKLLPVAVSAEDGRRALQPVAQWLHEVEGRTRASAADLVPQLEPALRAVGWTGGTAREFLATVRDESGLLTGWGQDEFGFMHLGFQEYLAAAEIRRLYFEGDDAQPARLAARFGQSWWQEVVLLFVAQGNPSPFVPFLRELLERPEVTGHPALFDALLEDAAGKSEAPFLELLAQAPGTDEGLWARQALALRVLDRWRSPALDALKVKLARHPSAELRRWLRDRSAGAPTATLVTEKGGVELIRIPAGSFRMGSPENENGRFDWEGPQHPVTVAEFHIGKYPVTNQEYGRFLAANPDAKEPAEWANRKFNQPRQPVVGVSWHDALEFARWAGCRLPTEAEWEFVARAGTTAPYLEGADEKDLDRFGWYDENSGGASHPVGEKAPNEWGLHDVLGNVWEWVEDHWHSSYEGAPGDGSAWVDTSRAASRVYRGGSWYSPARVCRVAFRAYWAPGEHSSALGFRVARSFPSSL